MLNRNLNTAIRVLISKSFQPNYTPINTTLIQPFSTQFYSALKSSSHKDLTFKSSSLKFRSNEMLLLPFFFHPAVSKNLLQPNNQKTQFYHIKDTPTVTLNFMSDASEELAQQAWQNRKNITLTFKQVIKIIRVAPLSNHKLIFNQTYSTENNNYTTSLTIIDNSSNTQILFTLKKILLKQNSEQEIQRTDFSMSYQDYPVFLQSISTNILYISGLKFSLELTKQQTLLSINNDIQQINTTSQPPKKSPKGTYEAKPNSAKANNYRIKRTSQDG